MKLRKYVSMLLCGAMLCTAMPLTAYAGTDDATAADAMDEEFNLPVSITTDLRALVSDEANRHIAANPDQGLSYRIWSIYYQDDWNGKVFYISLTSCLEQQGAPDENMTENVDYCDYDPEAGTYQLIWKPYEMVVRADWSDTDNPYHPAPYNTEDTEAEPDYFRPSDRFVYGDHLYVRDFDENDNILLTTSYVPVVVKTNIKNPLTGKDDFYLASAFEDQDTNGVGNGKYNVSYQDDLYVQLSGDGLELRQVNDRLWKPEAGDLFLTMCSYNPERSLDDVEISAKYETASGSGTSENGVIKSEGALTLIFEITQEAEEYKVSTLSNLFSEMYYFSSRFRADEPADDDYVTCTVASDFYRKATNENLWQMKAVSETAYGFVYDVPYDEFIAHADRLFAKHTDLKDYLSEHQYGATPGISFDYRADAGIVRIPRQSGGAGGWDWFGKMMHYYQDGDMIYIRGVSSMAEGGMAGWTVEDGMVENYDYFTETTADGSCRYRLGDPFEVTVRETDDGYQIVSYDNIDFYLIDNTLYVRDYKEVGEYGAREYTKTDVYKPLNVEIQSIGGQVIPTVMKLTDSHTVEFSAKDGTVVTLFNPFEEQFADGIFRFVNGQLWLMDGDILLSQDVTQGDAEMTFFGGDQQGRYVIRLNIEYEPAAGGDLDGDGTLSTADAVLLARVLAETAPEAEQTVDYDAADADGDGFLTILDVTAVLRKLMQA